MQSMRGASIACALTMALVADAEASRGYLGIDVVVRPEGLMVWRVLPGPLDGTLLDCASVARGDLIVSIDGEAASIESWNAFSARESGSKVRIGLVNLVDGAASRTLPAKHARCRSRSMMKVSGAAGVTRVSCRRSERWS